MAKTYVVIRADLSPGLQIAQACHAAIAFTSRYGVLTDNLVALQAPDEASLRALCESALAAGVKFVVFHEPDMGNEITAVALDDGARPFLSCLPLALRAAA